VFSRQQPIAPGRQGRQEQRKQAVKISVFMATAVAPGRQVRQEQREKAVKTSLEWQQ